MNPWNPPGAYGLMIVPHGRLSSGVGSGGIPYMLRDGRTAYDPGYMAPPGLPAGGAYGQEVVPGLEGAGPLTLFLGPQPEPPTLVQRVGQILQHPATGWAVAAALLGALWVRRGRAATAWSEPWRGAPWGGDAPWSR